MSNRNLDNFQSEAKQAIKDLDDSVRNIKVNPPDVVSNAVAMTASILFSLMEDAPTYRKIGMLVSVFKQVYKHGYKVGSESLQLHAGHNKG